MRILLNDQWEFVKMPAGSGLEDLAGADWAPVDLPHDWLIWQTGDLYETADAWYRRALRFGGEDGQKRRLRFDGVYMDCDILLNREVIASHAYGYTAFDVDLTGRLAEGDNELLVHIRHQSPNSRWYSGSGIYRDAELMIEPVCRFVPDSFYVITEKTSGGWRLTVSAEVEDASADSRFSAVLKDTEGSVLACAESGVTEGSASAVLECGGVSAWSLENRSLYPLELAVGDHRVTLRIGFRTIAMTPDQGFFLNGEPVKLKGVCLHHDLGALGAAFHEKAARRQLRVMKEMGFNALRTSHNPPAAKLLELCDEMGILVVDEAFDMWERSKTDYDYARFFPEQEAADVASWVRRDRTHACVILWSIGNEIYDMHADERGREVTRMLMEQVRSHDPLQHAVVTFGSNYMPWEGAQKCADIVKIPGYNYAERFYAEHHAAHPDWVIYGSETASVLSSRDVYHFPAELPVLCEADLQCSDLGNSTSSWGAQDLRKCIVDDLNTPYSMGQFLWSGIDYIGEPTPYHTRSCYFGQTDTACFPKEAYYLIKSLWRAEPMLHIGVYWDFNPGQLIDVRVMTNAASAELFLNGRSLGRKAVDLTVPELCCPVWQVSYEKGELLAVGYNAAGEAILTHRRVTPEDAAHLLLSAEDAELRADGDDLTFVTVTVSDRFGNPVENASNRVRVTVEGPGCLLGMDNGDSTDTDPYKCDQRRLFNGKLLIMIGALSQPGTVRVLAESEGLEGAELCIPVLPAAVKAGTSRVMRIPVSAPAHDVPVRKIEITVPDGDRMNAGTRELFFRARLLPENADPQSVCWDVTTRSGVSSPCAKAVPEKDGVRVTALGDGELYLRASCRNGADHPRILSYKEISITGLGTPYLDPYHEISAGLFQFSEGDIGAGNEKGIAFSRFGRSCVGFRNLDFGPVGSDTLILPIFALDGNRYDIDMYLGDPAEGAPLYTTLHYQKPSIWNVYQQETFRLPSVLTGVRTVAFAMTQKVHLRGLWFEPRSKAFLPVHYAADADEIYGDRYTRAGSSITDIGNNVSLKFSRMDFADCEEALLTIDGQTPLEANAIPVRMAGADGQSLTELVTFAGTRRGEQSFRIRVTPGMSEVTFVFLPGSHFHFHSFRFEKL